MISTDADADAVDGDRSDEPEPETEDAHDGEPVSYRPALVKLSDDVADLQTELLDGFDSRTALLSWLQRLSVRLLGEVPQRVYRELARQVVLDQLTVVDQGALLAALLTPAGRSRELPEDAVDELRERFVASQLRPAYHRAFRELRKDATEYVDDASDGSGAGDEHDPHRQRHPAMRPALREIDEWQQQALDELLAGFDEPREILNWGTRVEHATHGELDAIEPPDWSTSETPGTGASDGRDFIQRCYVEPSTRRVLTADGDDARELRECFAAVWIAPAFNRGVRVIAGRAGELPDVEKTRSEAKQL